MQINLIYSVSYGKDGISKYFAGNGSIGSKGSLNPLYSSINFDSFKKEDPFKIQKTIKF